MWVRSIREEPVGGPTSCGHVIGEAPPSAVIGVGQHLPCPQSLAVFRRHLLPGRQRIFQEAEQQRQIEELGVGQVVDADRHGLADDGSEQ